MSVAINLLPVDVRQRSIRSVVIRVWTPVLLLLSIAVALIAHVRWMHCEILADQAALAEPGTMVLRQRMQDIRGAESVVAGLQRELASLTTLQPDVDPLNVLQAVCGASLSCRDTLVITGMEIVNSSGDSTAPGTVKATSVVTPNAEPRALRCRQTTLNLSGAAVSDVSVARLVSGLKESGIFQSVQLKSSMPTQSSTAFQREFVVSCLREEVQL